MLMPSTLYGISVDFGRGENAASKRYLKIVSHIAEDTVSGPKKGASLKKLRHASIVDDKDERSGLVGKTHAEQRSILCRICKTKARIGVTFS
jgi:hypothetical protein